MCSFKDRYDAVGNLDSFFLSQIEEYFHYALRVTKINSQNIGLTNLFKICKHIKSIINFIILTAFYGERGDGVLFLCTVRN